MLCHCAAILSQWSHSFAGGGGDGVRAVTTGICVIIAVYCAESILIYRLDDSVNAYYDVVY